MKPIKSALISVFHKEKIKPLIQTLRKHNIQIFSTGGTLKAIQEMGYQAKAVEKLTGYPSVLGGRVKTLHPLVFGGILKRRHEEQDQRDSETYQIPDIDLVIVDLYPFTETVAQQATHQESIEKIDIGGISLIRAAAKNYHDTMVVPSVDYFDRLLQILDEQQGRTTETQRREMAAAAFAISSAYDTAIFHYLNAGVEHPGLRFAEDESRTLRYGENPHQDGVFYGALEELLEQLHGKEISYNNIVDIDAGVQLISEFDQTVFAVLKHTNACGLAVDQDITTAWKKALAGDPVSAFGGVLVTNAVINKAVAEEINKIFFEVLVAPDYDQEALAVLKQKKNRILLKQKRPYSGTKMMKSALNGVLIQDRDVALTEAVDWKLPTQKQPQENQKSDLLFAMKAVKHTKSNAIVLVKGNQLLGSGVGQTSRVDALKQAIEKAQRFGFDLEGAVMGSDAFFPFADSVEIAHQYGISAVIQPGGSKRDEDSIRFCDEHQMAMVFTGKRHFKH
ncbi:MAG: bifunctional phosphoribosylaminoimidazolecarboxamide formyltransferase/IMP cyclohydrolase [Bacteroidales bacterium]